MKNISPLVFFLLAMTAGGEEKTRVDEEPATEEVSKDVESPEGKKQLDEKTAAGEDTQESTSKAADPEASSPVNPDIQDEVAKAELAPPVSLKNRKLSEAIEQFIPTETISADNAVPFPVDI